MNGKYEELEGRSGGVFFIAAVKKAFEKRAVRLAASAAAVVISLFAMNIVSRYYGSAVWWAKCLLYLPFFVMLVAGVGGFVSNIGEFRVRRFAAAAIVCGITMWAVMAVYGVVSAAYLPIERALFWKGLGLELLRHIALVICSLAAVLLPAAILAHRKKHI